MGKSENYVFFFLFFFLFFFFFFLFCFFFFFVCFFFVFFENYCSLRPEMWFMKTTNGVDEGM